MKVLILLACVVAAACAVTVEEEEWSSFKSAHGKKYETETEEAFRRKIYQENKKEIEEHNARFARGEVSFERELNMFADMLSHEVAQQRNGYKMDGLKNKVSSKVFKKTGVSVPESVDWREKGYVTDVKDQGACGSCWAFSTTGSLEGQLFKKTGKLVALSEMQLVQCSKQNNGCGGGLMDYAFEDIKKINGIDTEKSYGYNELTKLFGIALPFCGYKAKNSAGTVTGYVDVNQYDEEALKEAVATVGPVSIAIDASKPSFSSYKSGIYYDERCSSTELDHGVLVVGYGSENGQDYWIVKNSWNANWGEKGYVRIARNRDNHCGVASQASYPTV